MKITIGQLRQLISEAMPHRSHRSRQHEFTFPVFGANDEEITVHAVYDERTPFEVEIYKAVEPDGNEADLEELGSHYDLHAQAMEWVEKNLGGDGIGLDHDDIYGKKGIDY